VLLENEGQQTLHRLQQAHDLEEKVGQNLGTGEVLQ
jgi:hypothetical protein